MTGSRLLAWFSRRNFRPVPLVLVFGLFFLAPQAFFLRMAFYESGGLGTTVGSPGFETIGSVLGSDFYQHAIRETLRLSLYTTGLAITLALPLAYVMVRKPRLGGVLFTMTAATLFSSAIVHVLGWKVLLAGNGPINQLLVSIGLVSQPLAISNNFTAVVIGTVHAILPIAAISLMPVCQAVPQEHLSASRALGASELRTFVTVFLPQARGGILSVSFLIFAIVSGVFTTPVLLGGGRVSVLSILMFQDTTRLLNYSRAAALALILFVIVGTTVSIGLLLSRQSKHSSWAP